MARTLSLPMLNLQRLLNNITDVIYPSHCIRCGAMGIWLCPVCEHSIIPLNKTPICPNGIDGVLCFFPYNDPIIRQLTAGYKKQASRSLDSVRERLLSHRLTQMDMPSWLLLGQTPLVPIPSPVSRIAQRGIDHTQTLAESFSKVLPHKPPITTFLKRKEHSLHNAELSYDVRALNVRDTFHVQKTVIPDSVVLIDDVLTSGATSSEAALFLKSQGVSSVYLLTFALS